MSSETGPLKLGEVVMEKPGGVLMTIAALDERKGEAVCTWHGPRGSIKRRAFLLESLRRPPPHHGPIKVVFR